MTCWLLENEDQRRTHKSAITFQLMYLSYRPIIIKAIGEKETPTAIPRSPKRCMVHFLDIKNINQARVYLKSAWSKGAIGAYDFYLVTIEIGQVPLLNSSVIFDFKRLLIATTSRVWKIICMKIAFKMKKKLQSIIRDLLRPDEFAKKQGLFRKISMWGPQSGLFHN